MGINSLSLSRINSEINDINTQLAGLKNWKSQLISLNKSILNSTNELNDITEVEEVHLPDNFYDELNQINLDLSRHEEYTKLLNDLSFNKSKVDELNKELESSKNALRLMEKYIKLTGSTGDVYREVMSRISKDFSDDVIRYEVNQYKFRNKDHLDLDVQYNVAGRWVSYQSLSSGQKTMADINFLSRILVECGLLVFDETLKHLSQSSTEYCLDLMRGMNVHTMILTTHMYGTESFANKNITLNLTEKGLTKVDIR
jgi:DNA repair exonuclease SbcCD ATPase subunit